MLRILIRVDARVSFVQNSREFQADSFYHTKRNFAGLTWLVEKYTVHYKKIQNFRFLKAERKPPLVAFLFLTVRDG